MKKHPPTALDLPCLALLALAVAAFFWPLLLTGHWIPRGGGDLVSFLWPMARFAARSLRAAVVPLWNPHLYSGAPFVADNQSGVFYPVNLLVFALFGEPSYGVMEGLVLFHMWLAGASMFALGRGLSMRRPAALAGGIAFAFSDLFVTHIGNLNLNATAAWMPLLLLLTHRALTQRGPGRAAGMGSAAGAGAVLAVAALAGHGQMLLFLALALALYVLYRMVVDRRQGWRYGTTTLLLAALIAAVGLGGSALMLLPAQEMAAHTGRGHLAFDEATRYSLPPQALIGLLAPDFYGRGAVGFWGPWDRVEVGYAGVATLVLAAVGLGAVSTRWICNRRLPLSDPQSSREPSAGFPAGFFALLLPAALLLAMGRYTPLYGLLYRWVPAFDQVRVPARLIVLADFGLAALAAYGLDRLARGLGRPARTGGDVQDSAGILDVREGGCPVSAGKWVGMGALFAAGALLVVGLPQAQAIPLPDRIPQATANLIVAAVLLGLSGPLVWLVMRRQWTAWLFPLILAVDLIGMGSTLEIEGRDPTEGFRHEDVVAFLRQDPDLFRIDGDAGAWQPDAALVHGLYDIGGIYNPLGLAPYQAYRWAVGERGAPLYNLLGVKYVLADKGLPPGDERLVPVYTDNPEIDVYLNTAALPRALLVAEALVVDDHQAAWDAVHSDGFDPTQTVVLERPGIGDTSLEAEDSRLATAGGGHIAFVRYGLNNVALRVRAPVSAVLVLSDVYYPGWRATVDDAPAEILRADYAFRGVSLPPGDHDVEMAFAPWTWTVGLAVSVLTWVGLGIWACLARRSRLRRDVLARGTDTAVF